MSEDLENDPMVSIIIPIYNAKKHLETCLDSVLRQTWKKLEVILIDDGSTDGSAGVCDEYALSDKRIRVTHQENMGAAIARKNGVLQAFGKYICFADADDWLQEGMVKSLVENIEDGDLITSGCYQENQLGVFLERKDSFDEGSYDTEERKKYFINNMVVFENRFEDGVLPFLWNKMYRADILKDVIKEVDTSIVYAEDRDLVFRYILRAKKIKVMHRSFYYYQYNNESIMRKPNLNFMEDLNRLYLSLLPTFEAHPLKESLIHQLQLFIVSRIYQIPRFMGFSPDTQMRGYVPPFSDLECGSRVILYGAGRVGVDYYRHIYRWGLLKLVLWVDKAGLEHNKPYPVVSPEKIDDCEYDYIIIAVKQKGLADEIKKELAERGIINEKILWRVPAIL